MAQITYIADYNVDYDDATCRFFRSPKDAEAWANNNEDYQDADVEFEFGEDITGDTYEITSGTIKYSKGLVVAINGGLGEYTFPEQFMIQDMSQEECIAELKKLEDPDDRSEFDEYFCSGAFFTKAIPGKGDDYAWLQGGGGGTEYKNGKKDFDFYWREGDGEISYNSGKSEPIGESVQTLKNVKLFEEFIKINN